jgi:hypothetical protein
MVMNQQDITKLTQEAFPDFQGFSQDPMMATNTSDMVSVEWLPTENTLMPEEDDEMEEEVPVLIQTIASISPEVLASTPTEIKMEAIRMLLG